MSLRILRIEEVKGEMSWVSASGFSMVNLNSRCGMKSSDVPGDLYTNSKFAPENRCGMKTINFQKAYFQRQTVGFMEAG